MSNQTEEKVALGEYSIELDCAPGTARPDSHIASVLDGTPLEPEDYVNTSRVFGNWTYYVKEEKNKLHEEHRPTIEANVKKLYHAGWIRYGSW